MLVAIHTRQCPLYFLVVQKEENRCHTFYFFEAVDKIFKEIAIDNECNIMGAGSPPN